jgi:hypothetical protein
VAKALKKAVKDVVILREDAPSDSPPLNEIIAQWKILKERSCFPPLLSSFSDGARVAKFQVGALAPSFKFTTITINPASSSNDSGSESGMLNLCGGQAVIDSAHQIRLPRAIVTLVF